MRELIYNALKTPDGTILHSKHKHDYIQYTDANGKLYMLDGGGDYIRCSANGDEEFISVYSDEPFEKVRKFAFRNGYGKDGNSKKLITTFLCDMSDDYLDNTIEYFNNIKDSMLINNTHYNLLLKEKEYRNDSTRV